jgi:glycosyltransferase involved in cell wall biosynthesis
MKVSYCIPCDYGHFRHLDKALQGILKSSELPDEICIAISGISNANPDLDSLKSGHNIPLNIKTFKEKRNAGANRNTLSEMAKHDILSFQDADDLVHPSRLKIIKHVFDTTDLVHLATGYSTHKSNDLSLLKTNPVELERVKLVKLKTYYDEIFLNGLDSGYRTKDYGNFPGIKFQERSGYVANGPVSIRKEVINKVRWKDNIGKIKVAEDQDFNYEVFFHFNRSGLVQNILYFYNTGDRKYGGNFAT